MSIAMPGFGSVSQKSARWGQFLVAVALPVVLLAGLDGFEQIQSRNELQRLADNAAMAGVQALKASAGENDAQRREAAVAASRAAANGATNATVQASLSPIYVSVELTQSSGLLRRINGRLDVVGQAGYLPPSQPDSEQQAHLYNRLQWNVRTARSD